MYLQAAIPEESPDDLAPPSSLPVHIRQKEDLLNRFLSGDNKLTPEEQDECRRHLFTFWKPVGDEMRERWMDKLYLEQGIKPNAIEERISSRVVAAVEAQIRNSFSSFIQRILGEQKLELRIVEVCPETFDIMLAPLDSPGAARYQTMLESVMEEARRFAGVEIGQLKDARRKFFPLALKVRNVNNLSAPPLTEEERKLVENLLQPLSENSIALMEEEITTLLQRRSSMGGLERPDQRNLTELFVKQLWYMWATMNPEIRDSVLEKVQNPDPIGVLLKPMLPGAKPRPHQTIDPPTEADIVDLEIMMNNLLAKFRDGTLDPEREGQKLDYLLQPLMDPSLMNLINQIVSLQWKAVSPAGLTTNENLKLTEFMSQFGTQFLQWKIDISGFGVLLDKWWWDPEAIQQVFENAWKWKEATKDTPYDTDTQSNVGSVSHVTPPLSMQVIEDDTLRHQFEVRQLLNQFAEEFEGIQYDRLLLAHMDAPLAELYQEIQELRDSAANGPLTLEESLRLREATGDFVRDHMAWYSGLEVRNKFEPLIFLPAD